MSTRSPRWRSWASLAAALLCGGCEPTQVEAGQCIVLVAPVITAIAMGLHALYARLWRWLDPAPRVSWRISQKGFLVLFILAAVVLVTGLEREADDWLGVIFIIVGSSYLTLFTVVMRLSLMTRLRRWFAWAPLLPWLVYLPPALVLALFGSTKDRVADALQLFWMLPGLFGYIGAPLLLLIVVEAGVQRYLHHRASRPPPPELPRSVVVRERRRKQ